MESIGFNPAYISVMAIGLLHGLEPGHGWPVAVLYSMQKRNIVSNAFLSSAIIGSAHLLSSIAVVVAYVLLQSWLDFDAPWLKYLAAALLLFLAYRMFRQHKHSLEKQHGHLHPDKPNILHEHEHEHPGHGKHNHKHQHTAGIALSLLSLAAFAFILGFAHEEEFALLALVASGVNAWVLMLAYGISVLLGLMAVTILGIKIYKRFQPRFARYESHIPKIGAVILTIMAIIVLLW